MGSSAQTHTVHSTSEFFVLPPPPPRDVLNIPGAGPSAPSLCSLGCLHAFTSDHLDLETEFNKLAGSFAWQAHIGTFKYNLISRP